MFSDTRLHFLWESKPSKTDDNAPNRNVRCMPPSPFSFRVAQARIANHVTTTFFTIRAASAKQLQFVLISSIEIFPILLHLPNLDHQIWSKKQAKRESPVTRHTSRLSIPPSYLTIYGLDCWLLNPRTIFDGKNCGAHLVALSASKFGGEVSQIYFMLYQ